ncbi:MAG: DUF433 domain-containing protein [Campylobacterales bacterium]|nr:DUF433 domain-containing protein [Campylobacterales bacterium]
MNWKDYIVVDNNILLGKPTIKNTRLSVEFILGLFAAGWDRKTILENYPTLSNEAINAVFSFSLECMQDEAFFSISKSAA